MCHRSTSKAVTRRPVSLLLRFANGCREQGWCASMVREMIEWFLLSSEKILQIKFVLHILHEEETLTMNKRGVRYFITLKLLLQ